MLLALVLFPLLQLVSGNIDCRTSCRRCRERTDDPELVEVYCAMCDECKERRREWLEGGPSLSIRGDEDDCYPLCEDECETTPILLTGEPETTTVTTTTTTSTTRRPCVTRPRCPKPCAVPLMPFMPMCSMCTVHPATAPAQTIDDHDAPYPTTSMYLYLGVPKNLANEINLDHR